MNVENERRFGAAALGGHQPGVDRVTLGMLDAQVLDRPAERPEPAAAVGRQRAQFAVFDGVDVGGLVG